ncbi:hypothetical protein D3C85_1318530 [compost metagenome]
MTQPNLTRTGLADLDLFKAKNLGATGFIKSYDLGHAFFLQSAFWVHYGDYVDWNVSCRRSGRISSNDNAITFHDKPRRSVAVNHARHGPSR